MTRRILVTGARGFVGRVLVSVLQERGFNVRAASREPDAIPGVEVVAVGAIGENTDWSLALSDVDGIVHLAARVHVMRDLVSDPLTAFRQVNVRGSEELARQAALTGVQRFVFVSSVKVNGEQTTTAPFREEDVPAPQDPYGISKWEAEQSLRTVARETGLEVVVLRPPLVYGPGVKANFLRMIDLCARGWPLPLGGIDNRRSLVFVGNLVDAIICCLDHPAAKEQTFLLSDGEDLSTPELIQRLASALDRSGRLLSLPPALLHLVGRILGKADEVGRLTSCLQLDSSRIRQVLGWVPPYTTKEGLAATASWYRGLTGN